jgi:hypothetical protein
MMGMPRPTSAGFSPFYAEDRMQKYERIMTAELRMPSRGISPTAQDMLHKVRYGVSLVKVPCVN